MAALGHGVAGVDRQIHQHLLDLAGIRVHDAEVIVEHRGDLDVLAQQAPQHLERVLDDGAQIECHRLDHLAAGKREQLASQSSRPFGRLRDLLDAAAGRVVRLQVQHRQLGVAEDRGQQVVEVVSDAAGEPADALQLLGLRELVLESAALGDVLDQAVVADQRSVGRVLRHRRRANPPDGAVLADDPMFDGPHAPVRLDVPNLLENHLPIFEEDHVEPQTRVCGEILGAVPGDRDAARAVPGARDVAVGQVHVDDVVRDRLGDAAVPLLALGQGRGALS